MKNKVQSLFWGILAAGAALFIELLIASVLQIDDLSVANVIFIITIASSAFIEEIFKYIVIIKSIDTFSFGRSAIINSWIAGLGFSLVEILFFLQKVSLENLLFDRIDLFKVAFLHILTFGIFGYKVATKENNKLDIGLIVVLSVIHFTYNMTVQYSSEIAYPAGNLILLILFLYNIISFITVNKRLAHE